MTGEAAQEAARKLAGARDDPRRRLDVAAGLYGDRPGGPSIQAYRRAELAFMRWQVSRGVLAPLDSPRPGSAWWRAVNEDLLRDAREARYLVEAGAGSPSHRAVTRWVQFLERPSPRSWYRAHNASIVAGYVEHRPLADGELPVERFFMDVALGRVLFVHILVTSPSAALGRWLAPMGRPLGDPRWRGADLYLSMRNVLPDRYPLSGLSIAEVLEGESRLGRLIDYGVLLPRAQLLYELAAADLDALLESVSDGSLVYAWALQDRDAWARGRSGLGARLIARMTPPRPRPDGGPPRPPRHRRHRPRTPPKEPSAWPSCSSPSPPRTLTPPRSPSAGRSSPTPATPSASPPHRRPRHRR